MPTVGLHSALLTLPAASSETAVRFAEILLRSQSQLCEEGDIIDAFSYRNSAMCEWVSVRTPA